MDKLKEENELKLTRKELLGVLGVKEESLKKIISRKQLYKRLMDKGYKYIGKEKKGRNHLYIIKQISKDKEILNNISNVMFNTKDDYKLGDYILYRTYNIDRPITKKMISDLCNVNRNTITRWDEKMIENGFMTKDGYFYVAIDYNENNEINYRLTDKYEYCQYYSNSKFAKKTKDIAEKYKKDIISYDEMRIAMQGIDTYAKTIENKFVYKVNKFNIIKNNKLFIELLNLIKATRIDKDKIYTQDYLMLE